MTEMVDKTETNTLRFNSHQDALDYARHVTECAKDRLALQDANFPKRYIDRNMEIVVRCEIGGTDGEYDFILTAIPVGRMHEQRTLGTFRPTEDHGIKVTGNRLDERVFVYVPGLVQCPEERIASFVRLERAYDRHDIRVDALAVPYNETFKTLGVVSERKVRAFGRSCSRSGDRRVDCMIEHAAQIEESMEGRLSDPIGHDLKESNFELFLSRVLVYLCYEGPRLFIKEPGSLPFKVLKTLLCPV